MRYFRFKGKEGPNSKYGQVIEVKQRKYLAGDKYNKYDIYIEGKKQAWLTDRQLRNFKRLS